MAAQENNKIIIHIVGGPSISDINAYLSPGESDIRPVLKFKFKNGSSTEVYERIVELRSSQVGTNCIRRLTGWASNQGNSKMHFFTGRYNAMNQKGHIVVSPGFSMNFKEVVH
jgi:hypothetical protein